MKTSGLLFCVAFLLLALNIAAEKPPQDDHLKRYVDCQWVAPFSVADAVEQTEGFRRPVRIAIGNTTVEVRHGFSLHIAYSSEAYPNERPFVNFKAEKLTEADYQRDKELLVDQMELMAADSPGFGAGRPRQDSRGVFDVYSIHSSELRNGVTDVYSLFRDADYTVVTLYVLNPVPEDNKFRRSDYELLRDYFLRFYVKCVSDKQAPKDAAGKQQTSK